MLAGCARVRHGESADADVAPVPGAALDERSIGHRLLQRMGWSPGTGLGTAGNEGRVVPISEELKAQDGRGGLRAANERGPQAATWTARPRGPAAGRGAGGVGRGGGAGGEPVAWRSQWHQSTSRERTDG